VLALESGWVVTEVGRQPWTVVGVLLTKDAVTTTGNIWLFFSATVVLYAAVGSGTIVALRLLRRRWRDAADGDHAGDGEAAGDPDDVPYGPSRARETARAGGGEP
jgi:cytochrome d ubiquinol oxidase subunit I